MKVYFYSHENYLKHTVEAVPHINILYHYQHLLPQVTQLCETLFVSNFTNHIWVFL